MTEIFRHFRVKNIDQGRMQIVPDRNGGISYMLKPTGEGTYDFWIYICPLNAEFSAKQAVHCLRIAQSYDVVPWGSITMDGTPIIDLLVDATTKTDLPTETSKMVEWIKKKNHYMEVKLKQLQTYWKKQAELYKEENVH